MLAIGKAISAQLGLNVLEIEPFGLEGSGGSTPLRIKVESDPDKYVFAKLYSQTHLRSDRWYKVGRTILYGSLEDEVRFATVRRLVEYEDYIQRLMRDAGVPCGPIYKIDEVFADPQVEALSLAQSVISKKLGELNFVRQPITLSRTPSSFVSAPPEAGEHTDEVLAQLGYSTADIDELRTRGVV